VTSKATKNADPVRPMVTADFVSEDGMTGEAEVIHLHVTDLREMTLGFDGGA
jgi:hypothetical protein